MRSFLFIPGDSPKKLDKGIGSGADALLIDLEDSIAPQGKAAARATDDYVHEHPWGAVGIAAAVGLVIGMLISRR